MYPLAISCNFKVFQAPLLPVAGTVDLAPFLIMILLLTLGAALMRWRWGGRRQWLRRFTQFTATLAFVFGLHPCACMIRDLLRGAFEINYDNVRAFLLMMLIIPVATFAMVWGRVFCGWVCPIGFIQELANRLVSWVRGWPDAEWVQDVPVLRGAVARLAVWLRPWSGRERLQHIRFALAAALLLGTAVTYAYVRPANEPVLQGLAAGYLIVLAMLIIFSVADRRWEVRLWNVRYAALSFFVVVTVLGIYTHAAFCVLFTNDWRRSPVLLLAGVLFASLVLSQAWCRFLCPEGALLGLLTRLSGWRIRLNRGRCTRCNTCSRVCPVECIDYGEVDEKSCLYCCRCADSCPAAAIEMAGEESCRESPAGLPVLPGVDG